MDRYSKAIEYLVESIESPNQLAVAYNKYLDILFGLSLWSSSNPQGRKIHWKDTFAAKDEMGDMFQSPGLYIFGHEDCPCLIGKTVVTLWGRLRGRYIGGERTQLELAETYADQIREAGIDGFPDEITNWYRCEYRGSTVRLDQAVAFCRIGVEKIWYALLPIKDTGKIGPLEKALIPIADKWNLEHGCPSLLNWQYN